MGNITASLDRVKHVLPWHQSLLLFFFYWTTESNYRRIIFWNIIWLDHILGNIILFMPLILVVNLSMDYAVCMQSTSAINNSFQLASVALKFHMLRPKKLYNTIQMKTKQIKMLRRMSTSDEYCLCDSRATLAINPILHLNFRPSAVSVAKCTTNKMNDTSKNCAGACIRLGITN